MIIETAIICGTVVTLGSFALSLKVLKIFPSEDVVRSKRRALKHKIKLIEDQRARLDGKKGMKFEGVHFSHYQKIDRDIAEILDELSKLPLSPEDEEEEMKERATDEMLRG
jgi:hypothetical protein